MRCCAMARLAPIVPSVPSVARLSLPPFLRMATTLLAKSNSPPSIRMEMNGEVQRVFLAKTCRCLPKLRTKSTRTCTSRMVLLASNGFLRPICTTGLSAKKDQTYPQPSRKNWKALAKTLSGLPAQLANVRFWRRVCTPPHVSGTSQWAKELHFRVDLSRLGHRTLFVRLYLLFQHAIASQENQGT